ncbi:retrovirus-related pol polyprotein from transposon TNT 1-94 [Tanacetum coccineum]
MKNDNVIAPGMFRINSFQTSGEEKYVPNKPIKASVRTKLITILHPHVLTKKHVKSDSNGLSSTRVDNTAKTKRPQSRSNTKNYRKFLGTVRFGNDHVAAILGFSDLQWGNILITRVYFVKDLGLNMFSVGQFCDLDLEVAFRRNTYFVRNLEGVDLLKGNHTTNLYIINLHEIASTWYVLLLPSHGYGINGKSKKASHPPKPVPNSKQRLHLLHMDLCGPIRVKSINGKRYVLVIVDDYSRYMWVHFLRSKDEAPKVIKTFLKKIQVLLQAPVIIVRTDNGTEFKNQMLKEYFDSVDISYQSSSVRTPHQNRAVE